MAADQSEKKSRVVRKVPVVSQIATHLMKDIQQGVWPVGARLETIRELAARFDTSVRTIHSALSELEQKGYVACRQGAGTYVVRTTPEFTLADTAILCPEAKGHIFGDLTALLCNGLHRLGMLPITADLSNDSMEHKSAGQLQIPPRLGLCPTVAKREKTSLRHDHLDQPEW
jgi:DNA-binding FadR family transcriptional regulator